MSTNASECEAKRVNIQIKVPVQFRSQAVLLHNLIKAVIERALFSQLIHTSKVQLDSPPPPPPPPNTPHTPTADPPAPSRLTSNFLSCRHFEIQFVFGPSKRQHTAFFMGSTLLGPNRSNRCKQFAYIWSDALNLLLLAYITGYLWQSFR